jgi:hypothetical protein
VAITTLDGIIANGLPTQALLKVGGTMEAAGVLHSLFYSTGLPGAAAAPSPGLSGAALTSYAGQIPFPAAVGGETVYLASMSASASIAGKLLLVDRLWHNSGVVVTTTTAQTITSATFPARDMDGATAGRGVLVGIEVSTATTNAGAIANTTLTYTNSGGTGSRTGTITSFPATAVAGTFVPFQLAAGDVGVRSVESVTLGTSYAGGAIHLVAYRVIAELPLIIANTGAILDPIAGGFPALFDGTVPQLLWLPTATTATTITGTINWAQG